MHAELPGMEEKDIEVSLLDNVLTLQGEKKHEKETKEKKTITGWSGPFGTFQRRVVLPAEVEADKVDATFKKGVFDRLSAENGKSQKRR